MEDGFDAGEGAAAEAGGGVAFGEELDGVGVQPEVEVGVGGEGLVVQAGEVGLGAPAREIGLEVGELGEGEAEIAPDGVVASLDLARPSRWRARRRRGQFGLGEGPAAVGNARRGGEVLGVELEDLASPADGRSALDADAAGVDAAMREADDLAVVEGLGGVFADGAAAFEEQDVFAFAGELDGEGDASGTGADDADVCEEAGGGVSWRRSRITGDLRELDSRRAGGLAIRQDGLDPLDDEPDLSVVVVAVAGGAQVSGGGDAVAGGFVGEIAADLFGELVEGGEEDGLFVFVEALEVACGALGEEEASAAGDLEALVDELVLIGVGEEAEVDPGAPDGVAIVVAVELAVAEDGFEGVGPRARLQSVALPETATGKPHSRQRRVRVWARSS